MSKEKNSNIRNEYYNYVHDNPIVNHAVNGLSRFLILWIIKYNKNIHGYEIIKELDKFFEQVITTGDLKQAKPGKIYPILKKMENTELIGTWTTENNKKIKYYSITEKGEFLVNYFSEKYIFLLKNSQGGLLIEDITNNLTKENLQFLNSQCKKI